jgi:hypothetical protein
MWGFVDPAREDLDKPLWHFDLESATWTEKSPAEVGWERGFYDYADARTGLEHPDVTFAKFEREYPMVRDQMLRKWFKDWVKQQKPFLLGYMQMMRARSPMFIQQQTEHNRNLRGATITSVGPGNQVTVDSIELRPVPEYVMRNSVISQMRQEIEKGGDWMWNINWCLRYTRSPADPFITSGQPLVVEGPVPNIVEAMTHPDTLIWFPLCWQACLVGSPRRFDKGTDEMSPADMRRVRERFRRPSSGYVISPCKIEW